MVNEMQHQLDFFEEMDDLKRLEERDRQIQDQLHNVRRGLFARLGKVYKWMIRQDEIMDQYGQRLADIEKDLAEKDKEIVKLKMTISWMESVA